MAMILGAEDADDWAYKGEGAANLVLSYHGSSPLLLGKVIRIQKVPKGRTKSVDGCEILSGHEQILWRNVEGLVESTSKEDAAQIFVMRVMSPLLGHQHIDGGIRVTVTRDFLKSVKKNVHSQRPAWRADASEIDILCDSALLISDHSVFLSDEGTIKEDICIAVEIKPKCGFLPSSEFIAKRNFIKKHTTRFRMHQRLKLHRGEISQMTDYDPLDLFSGSKDRINQAILALFETPQNNFRIFLNGYLIFGGLGGAVDNTTECLQERKEKIEDLIKVSGLQLDSFLELVTEALLGSAVLDQLLAAQKLDLLDIEGAIHAYYNITSEPCMVCKNLSDADLLQQYSFLHALSREESLEIVRNYLISATAKDCSLMMSFRPTKDGELLNSIFLNSCNQSFNYKANFIDLDMKSLEKMVYYYEFDQKIVNFYAKSMVTEEASVIGTDHSDDKKIQYQH